MVQPFNHARDAVVKALTASYTGTPQLITGVENAAL
jgi:hypothetical protein